VHAVTFAWRIQAASRGAEHERLVSSSAALAAGEADQAALFDMVASALLVGVDRVQFKLSAARAGLAAGPCFSSSPTTQRKAHAR